MGFDVEISECRLGLVRPTHRYEAPALGSFFGQKFEEEVQRHNHELDGTPIYQYPRVQFKVFDSTALLLGINEGSKLLQRLWPEIDETKLGEEKLPVLESKFETRTEQITVTAELIEYRFATPWLALNQRNFREYISTRNRRIRKEDLSRILVGNCLGLAKSLNTGFTDHIRADCSKLTSIKATTQTGKGMIGFMGKLNVNLEIPEHLGLGKAVSRGFGTVMVA